MGLFFDVLSAINNPNQNASVDQLGSVTNSIQQLAASHNVEPSTMQSVLSGLGGALAPALQQQATGGGLGNLVGQLAGGGAGAAGLGGLASIITPQLIQGLTQRTGVSGGTLQAMLPALLPIVMQLLNMGASKTGGAGNNPLVSAFLNNTAGQQNSDLGDVFKFATRFLNPPR
jgi:hypothetical protein